MAGVTSREGQRQRGRRRADKARNARSAHEKRGQRALTAEDVELVAEHEYLDVLSKVLRRRAPSSPMTRTDQ